jgi:hypothetical protein
MTIILKWILGEVGRVCTGCIWLRIGTCGELCEHGIELSDSIKGGKFLD